MGLFLLALAILIPVVFDLTERRAGKSAPRHYYNPPYMAGTNAVAGLPIVRLGQTQYACTNAEHLQKYPGVDLDALPTCDHYGYEIPVAPMVSEHFD